MKNQKKLFEHYNRNLFISACTFLNDEEQAKEIVQETWIDIFKGLDGYDVNKSKLITWMKTILIRKIWKSNKQKKKVVELDQDMSKYNHQTQIIEQLTCQEILNEIWKNINTVKLQTCLILLNQHQEYILQKQET